MRVVFMGTPEFAVPSLRAVASAHEVVAVYTQPDRPRGRGREPRPSPVKVTAHELGLPVEQPSTLKDADIVDRMRSYAPDIICVAAYGLVLPPDVLAIPPHGCVNVHASLLPRHRGAAPVHRAILAGDEMTGVTIMRMEAGLDTGPYAAVRTVPVNAKNVTGLTEELAQAGAEALLESLDAIEKGFVEWTEQDDALATYAEKVTAEDVALDPGLTVEEALRRVRASSPSARARISVAGRTLDVLQAAAHEDYVAPGEVSADKDTLAIGVADGAIALGQVRPAGKPAMDGAAFARGAHLGPNPRWTAAR